jgi:charged multivesicular body protein 4A/B
LQDDLKAQLAELEQEGLNERLMTTDHVPVHIPAGTSRVDTRHQVAVEESEDAELKQLQAELAMS